MDSTRILLQHSSGCDCGCGSDDKDGDGCSCGCGDPAADTTWRDLGQIVAAEDGTERPVVDLKAEPVG